MSTIAENLASVEARIQAACQRAGRAREEVTLISVSKTKPVSDVREAMAAGARVFGENKVQEIREKTEAVTEPLDWHMIGHLQANKVKYLPGKVCMIHSVDNLKLAETIEKEFAKHDLCIDILCEVNMAGEDTKFGLAPEETESFIRQLAEFPHLRVRGLMTIAPFTEDAESNRVYFRGLKALRDAINEKQLLSEPMDTLSMGMTGDFEVAVEEGATMVRVGTAIFGKRDYAV